MAAAELAQHAGEFLRVARSHPQCIDSSVIEVTDAAARLFLVLDIEMPLAFRARGVSDSGVRKHERVEIKLGPRYPWRGPAFYLRADFPSDLPHLTPGTAGQMPRPCLVDGSAEEYFNHFGLIELGVVYIIDQMAIWLARAAANRLMNPEQGWEPLSRPDVPDDIVLNTDFARSQVTRQGGWAVVKSEYLRIGSKDTNLGSDAAVYLDASTDLTPLYSDPRQLRYTRRALASGAMGETITALVWPGKLASGQAIITARFLPETVTSLADLKVRAAEIGCGGPFEAFLTRFEQSFQGNVADFPLPIGVVLCVRRPFRLMNRQSEIELIPYALEVRAHSKRTHLFNADAAQHRVVPLRQLDRTTPGLLREVAGAPAYKPTSVIGCGSVGSKLALHLARAGAEIKAVADNRNLLPHNMARHGTLRGPLPTPKAHVLAEDLGKLGQIPAAYIDDVVYGLSVPKERRLIAPIGTQLVVNTTASLLVREALSMPPTADFPPRVGEVALFGRGNGAIVLMEGKGRNPCLSDLMATLYASVTAQERELLFDPAHGLTQVQIGESCGSLTMPMTDARLTAMTAAATEELERLSLADVQAGEIVIGLRNPLTAGTVWRRQPVSAFRQIEVNGGDWTLRLSPNADAKIRAEIADHPGVETGGYLIGVCSARLRTITVVDTLPAPPDSTRSSHLFVLGTAGAKAAILERHRASGETLLDVGTWHSHLAEMGPSPTDHATAKQLAAERAPPAILLIATPSTYCCIVHHQAG